MQDTVLNINIPQPCRENYDDMQVIMDQKFCAKCSHTIVDFSLMSDASLYAFLRDNPGVRCGRFHNSQLNVDIQPARIRRNYLKLFSKFLASALTVVVMRNTGVKAQLANKYVLEQSVPQRLPKHHFVGPPATISGQVTDVNLMPLAGVSVNVSGRNSITDERGF